MNEAKFSYESIEEMLLPSGNVAFSGYIHYHFSEADNNDNKTMCIGTVVNHGDGGSNIYNWTHRAMGRLFELTAEKEIPNPEFLEVVDEYVEKLYQESVGVTP